MFPLLIILLLALLLGIGLALLLPKRQLPSDLPRFLPSERASRGLFGDEPFLTNEETTAERRKALLARANAGDTRTLAEARGVPDTRLYGEVLDTLIEQTRSRQEPFDVLVSHILGNDDLRANPNLANRLIEQFGISHNRRRTLETLHLAALSDDAATFERAVDTILELWSEGRILELSAQELSELFDSEYWVIAPEARCSGAGFALKKRLAEVRGQLAIANRRA